MSSFGRDGVHRFFYWMLEAAAYERRDSISKYRRWLRSSERVVAAALRQECVMLVLTAPRNEAATLRCIESVMIQSHSRWRLVASEEGRTTLRRAPLDSRIDTERGLHEQHEHAGPVLLLDASCSLSPSALSEFLNCLATSQADIVYCDEDRVTNGRRYAPYLKPGFSIDLLRSEDYVGPTILVRNRKILAGDAFETCLRAFEAGRNVVRLPRVLVHFHVVRDLELTPQRVVQVQEHLGRCYGPHVAARLIGNLSSDETLVSLIIPTRDRVDLLQACLDSVYRDVSRARIEVIVLNNRSVQAGSLEWLANAPHRYANLRVIDADYPFNWSKLNNQGIANAGGSVLVFLNNDIEAVDAGWLDRLVAHCTRPDVGTVGALLLYPDGAIQHAGVVVGIFGIADHIYSGCPGRPEDRHVFTSPFRPRNVLASTGACLAVSRATLDKIGVFDETMAVCGDVEICIRAYRQGLMNVYDPRVRLLHHESSTRAKGPLPVAEIERLFAVCREFINAGDPFYNPGLTQQFRYPDFADAQIRS